MANKARYKPKSKRQRRKESTTSIIVPFAWVSAETVVSIHFAKDVKAEITSIDPEIEVNKAQAMTIFLDDGVHVVLPWTCSVNLIAHECLHVIHALFAHIDMSLSFETQEAYAYNLGYLVEQCCIATPRLTRK